MGVRVGDFPSRVPRRQSQRLCGQAAGIPEWFRGEVCCCCRVDCAASADIRGSWWCFVFDGEFNGVPAAVITIYGLCEVPALALPVFLSLGFIIVLMGFRG